MESHFRATKLTKVQPTMVPLSIEMYGKIYSQFKQNPAKQISKENA